jgi:hypothetical protein
MPPTVCMCNPRLAMKWNLFKLPIQVCLYHRFCATRVERHHAARNG